MSHTRIAFRVPGDGKWHRIPAIGRVAEIHGPLDVMVDIDDHHHGNVRAPADGIEREVEYVIGVPVL